ncbi:MAG: MFS transporter [Dehalococcoidales bacterium]|nr:MAG: MFS transporter [Dehalococcoidales bacterium]
MNISDASGSSKRRWFVLALGALTCTFVVAMPMMSMPVLFEEIAEDLELNIVQIGAVWGMVPLAGMFVVLIGGLLSDRFGIKRVLTIACFLAGVAGASRGLSGNFATLSATLFLFGLVTASIPPSVHKTCGIWFSGQHLGLANGVIAMGMAVGFTLGAMLSATVLSPLLGGWQNVLFLYGAISVVIGILWLIVHSEPEYPESPAGQENAIPFRQALSRVIRIKKVWILGLILMGQIGCIQGTLGYLSLYLQEIGWPGASADGALAVFHVTSMLGVLPLAFLSDRLRSRKVLLIVATLMIILGVGLLSVADGALVWVSVIIAGIVRDGFMAIFITTIIETEGVGPAYAGTAMGLVMTLSRLGGFSSPPIGNSLAAINPRLPFVFWASLAAVTMVGFYFLRQRNSVSHEY